MVLQPALRSYGVGGVSGETPSVTPVPGVFFSTKPDLSVVSEIPVPGTTYL